MEEEYGEVTGCYRVVSNRAVVRRTPAPSETCVAFFGARYLKYLPDSGQLDKIGGGRGGLKSGQKRECRAEGRGLGRSGIISGKKCWANRKVMERERSFRTGWRRAMKEAAAGI